MKEDHIKAMKIIIPTLKVTFKLPKTGFFSTDTPTRLSMKDCDFVETEVLRQFYINVSRVVKFEFVAYPEDRAKNGKDFVGLHYHAVLRSRNDAKFISIAKRKYNNVLKSRFQKNSVISNDLIFIEKLVHGPQSYEQYCVKNYCPSTRLVTHSDFADRTYL